MGVRDNTSCTEEAALSTASFSDATISLLEHCSLCPRACGANRVAGARGVCGAADELRIARAALHFWEEPPISGNVGSGAVFFSNCPLHCVYCQNEPIANGSCGVDVSVRRLACIFLELQDQGALNVNLVTPTHYVPQIIEAAKLAREAGLTIPFVYNTSGYETPETIALLKGLVDTYLVDFRYIDAQTARSYSKAPTYPEFAMASLDAMVEQGAHVIVRVLLLPTHLEETKRIVRYVHETYAVQETLGQLKLSLMSQYTPMGTFPLHPELEQRVDPEAFEELLDYADDIGCDDYFWQEGGAAEESFIPDFASHEGVVGPELASDAE